MHTLLMNRYILDEYVHSEGAYMYMHAFHGWCVAAIHVLIINCGIRNTTHYIKTVNCR